MRVKYLCKSSLFWICMSASSMVFADAVPVAKTGYLAGKELGYSVPQPPNPDSLVAKVDLVSVQAAQWLSSKAQHSQAFEDAAAYNYDQLLPRFNEAAGTFLTAQSRPILFHITERIFDEMGTYVKKVKEGYPRARPYIEDKSIIPCQTDYLPPSDQQSYPSGHAARGFLTALLLSKVIPDRKALILARGVQYGDNRVVCGVHHPLDVEQGRIVALAYFNLVSQQTEFVEDLNCAVEEHQNSIAALKDKADIKWSPVCKLKYNIK